MKLRNRCKHSSLGSCALFLLGEWVTAKVCFATPSFCYASTWKDGTVQNLGMTTVEEKVLEAPQIGRGRHMGLLLSKLACKVALE
eukprot:2531030-Amphidinium_carterae.1